MFSVAYTAFNMSKPISTGSGNILSKPSAMDSDECPDLANIDRTILLAVLVTQHSTIA